MPVLNILKRALDDIKVAAHRFSLEQFATWKENRDMILNWIDSLSRINTQFLHTASNFPDTQSNGMPRQESNQFPDTNHGVIRGSLVEVEPADQQPNHMGFVESTTASRVASHAALSENDPLIRVTEGSTRRQTRNSDLAPNRLDLSMRTNTQILPTASNSPVIQSSGIPRQESTQVSETNHGEIRRLWVEVVPADQQPNRAEFVDRMPASCDASRAIVSENDPLIQVANGNARRQIRNRVDRDSSLVSGKEWWDSYRPP
ncbi:hypothetical protein R1flu_027252 [Riccia fluitans]|uniref:Uncharacterized protein n=1 Tax=Riccia fluitans TaxID=41844 RepID=A0ABD1XI94_9MARC